MRIAVLATAVCLSIVGLSAASDVQAAIRRPTSIPAQGLAPALQILARDHDFQVVYRSEVVGKLRTQGASGELTADEALRQVLGGTGLTFRYLDDKTVTIAATASSAPTATDAQETPSAPQAFNNSETPDAGTAKKTGFWQRFRLAQNEPSSQTEKSSSKEEIPSQSSDKRSESRVIEEVVVTGTHIRGIGASAGTNVEVIDRDEIEKSGLATAQQVVQSLPTNFGGGPNEDTRLGQPARQNRGLASSINLRGLGPGSTLVLVNGRRIPAAGVDASTNDISTIPVTAIERIEVLSDGASAIYGADAIAGVVNVILRDDYEGAETRLRYGTVTDGNLDEYQFGQVFGNRWDAGSAFISYEFYKRENLPSSERDYTASSDLRRFGGEDFRSRASNPGNIADSSTFTEQFAIPEGQDGTSLTPDELLPGVLNRFNGNRGRDVLPEQQRHSLFATATQSVGTSITLFAEGRYTQRDFEIGLGGTPVFVFVPPTNPFYVDAFGDSSDLVIVYNMLEDLGPGVNTGDVESYSATLGGTVSLPRGWRVQIYGNYNREETSANFLNQVNDAALSEAAADPDPATAFNAFADGSNTNSATLDRIRATIFSGVDSELWSTNVVADGPLFRLPGGDVRLAVGADYRKETFDHLFLLQNFDGEVVLDDLTFEREVLAAFGELFIPIFGPDNRRPGLERLNLSISGRLDDYKDRQILLDGGTVERPIGTTDNPKFGVLWSPVDGVNLRGSYGTAFRAPNLPTLGEFNFFFDFPVRDPKSPTGQTNALFRDGVNPNLKDETATIWTAGLDVTPSELPGLRIGLTYFNIEFNDRIQEPPDIGVVFDEEEVFSSVITRNPSFDQVLEICNSGDTDFTSPAACTVPGFVEAIVDARTNNTAVTRVDGVDFDLLYGFDAGSTGRFDLRLNGSYLFEFKEAFSSLAPFATLVDAVHNPVSFRMRNSLTWSLANGFGATLFINYTDGYTDTISTPERKIDSWTTVDLTATYDSRDRLRKIGLNDTVFSLHVLNLFDEDAPFVNNTLGVGYDPENADPLGRFVAFNITKRW